MGYWINAGMQSSATINVSSDGHVAVLTGSPDIGGSRASMALMAAEVLGIPFDHVHPQVVATDSVGHTDVTGGSRTTLATGQAVIQAAESCVAEMCRRAAAQWGVEPGVVAWSQGAAHYGEHTLTFEELAERAGGMGGPLTFSSSLTATSTSPGFAVHICDAEVDKETGRTTITRYTTIQDAGKAIHPDYVEGQMQGGAVQGIGWALNEEYLYNADGVLENPGLPRLPHSGCIGSALYRYGDCRDTQSVTSLWCQGCGRGADCAADARYCRGGCISPPACASEIYR